MRHLTYVPGQSSYPVCFLVPTIRGDDIRKAYLEPYSVDTKDVLVIDLHYSQTSKRTPMAEMRRYISEELVPVFADMGIEYLVVTDAEYFKALTKAQKVDASLGYVMDCEFGTQKVIYVPSFRQIFYDPEKVTAKISQGMTALVEHRKGTYQPPGDDVIQFEIYPKTYEEIKEALDYLLKLDKDLACDIEGFSLKPQKAGVGTISFAWSKHKGIAFAVDYSPIEGATEAPYGEQIYNKPVRGLIQSFFKKFKRKLVFHHIAYDASVLIYQLFMKDLLDTGGMLDGISVIMRDWDDTKLISYLATNSCAGNKLSLKDQSQQFAGNYAMGDNIKDILKIPLDKLLRYNLIDGMATWYVREKHWDTMVSDQQLEIYETLFKPSTVDIVQMQLTGMPVNMKRVKEVKIILKNAEKEAVTKIQSSQLVQCFVDDLRWTYVCERNAKLKKKTITINDPEVSKVVFNPNSAPQLQKLLYEMLALPVLDYTDSKQPSTKAKTLASLKSHTSNPEVLELLDALLDYASVAIILETFIPAMENAIEGPDGWHYLFGNFNLGGTLSGRLSSSDPNLQNIPASSKYAKLIKSCFEAIFGWVFVGLDFNSLEDKISALTTKDPAKLQVYTDGYDGHSLRAYSYWAEQMPDIDPNSVESINSIEKKYKPIRQKSKAPTFALTYAGTYTTLMKNCGFSMEEAKMIEASYKGLYKVSIDWVAAKLDLACDDGYVTGAFGLRVRTPLLAQVIRGTSKTPHEAEAEGRSAGNALGQSWCLLNSRAWAEFMGKVRDSEFRLDIRPCAQIHDAGYAMVRDDVRALAYVNEHLVKAVQWQDHPDIWHDEVKIGGGLSIFWPTWDQEIHIPNGATEDEILEIVAKAIKA